MTEITIVKNLRRKKDKINVRIMGANYVEITYSLNPSDPLKNLINFQSNNQIFHLYIELMEIRVVLILVFNMVILSML